MPSAEGVELLREAAALMRSDHPEDDVTSFCACEDSDHWFDRSICPEPCGSMHDICTDCGRIKGYCQVAVIDGQNAERLGATWRAVADWLDETALRWEYIEERGLALAVARLYLGTAS